MITEEKIQEIRKQLKKGVPAGEVQESLLKEGYTNEDLEIVFRPHQYDMRSWYLFFGIIITITGLFFFKKNGGMLILILGCLLFVAYYYECRRLERSKK